MNVVSEAFEEKLGDKMSEIKYLALDNNELKNKISEAEITVDKISSLQLSCSIKKGIHQKS